LDGGGGALTIGTGDIAITFTTPGSTLSKANFEAALQYDLTGSAAANTIVGGGLDDRIDGGAESDVITGGAGSDTLIGGAAIDTLTGGTGADFIYADEVALGGTAANDSIVIVAADTGVATLGSTSTSAATIDKVYAAAGDVITVTGIVATENNYDGFGVLQTSGNLALVVTGTTGHRVSGFYDNVTDTFTVTSVQANAVMLSFADADAGVVGTDSIIIVGVTNVTSMTDGVITV
jgi:hypothetical protein